ncbi:PREDICTED: uncharacterized protein LOC108770761 [Trachymyrmex cornetzi]|uniref:uncharacterized protein LOC108770761 n=1 Tax=Trachymyrmex cornetzi TaxID=471704 RepID=UPI00084F0B14|nr:PREDICTED: uncharacterized protein LOC108770761 [Trachymyrmex cornetzi]
MESTNSTECKMKLLCKLPKGLGANGNLNENWHKVRQSFDIFLKVTNNIIKSDEVKIAILLNIVGKDGVELYNKFNLEETEKKNLAKVLQCFEEHCNPKKNVVHATFKFFSRIQQEDEIFENFLTDIKKLSQMCEFGIMTNRMVRDKIVFGIRDKALQDKFLKMEDLNLQKAINYCRAAEIREKNLQSKLKKYSLRKKVTQKSNRVRGKKATQKSNCSVCNTKHGPNKCLANGKKHKECSKLNYLPEEEEEDDERIPVRRWIRKNYTKLTTNKAKCNHCSEVFSYKYVPELPCHLRLVHPDKLTEKEKEDRKISWIWDYFTPGNNMTAVCNICNKTYNIVSTTRCLIKQVKRVHREIAAKFADDMSSDTNKQDTTTKKVESQGDLAASSNNLNGNTEETECSLSKKIIVRQTKDMSDNTNKNIIIIRVKPEEDATASSENTGETKVFKE